ncbi:MAG: ABC transporter ATP-binding protein, partial [Cyanobacteria bacterium J06659_2]
MRYFRHGLSQSVAQLWRSLEIYRYGRRAISLVWSTDWRLTLILAGLTIVGGLLPGAIAYVGKLIVDSVVLASQSGNASDRMTAFTYLGVEAILVAVLAGSRQGL